MVLWTSGNLCIQSLRSRPVHFPSTHTTERNIDCATEQIPLNPQSEDSKNLPVLQAAASDAPKKLKPRAIKKCPQSGAKSALEEEPSANAAEAKNDRETAELLEVDPNTGRRKRRKIKLTGGDEKLDNDSELKPTTPAVEKRGRGRPRSTVKRAAENTDKNEETIPNPSPASPARDDSHEPQADTLKDETPVASVPQPVVYISPYLNLQAPTSDEVSMIVDDALQLAHVEDTTADTIDAKPRKVLYFNAKTGTIGSPPPLKVIPAEPPTRRPSRKKEPKQPKSLVVTLQYGGDHHLSSSFGEKVGMILSGTQIAALFKEQVPVVKSKPVVVLPPGTMKVAGTAGSSNASHPFFQAKATRVPKIEDIRPPQDSIDLTSMSSCKPERTIRYRNKPPTPSKPNSTQNTAPSAFPGLGFSAKILKFPGAVEPAWPWRDMLHTRGADLVGSVTQTQGSHFRSRRSKYAAIQILESENIIKLLATELNTEQVMRTIRDINPDEYPPVPKCLRVPSKHLESGVSLQRRTCHKLDAKLAPPDNDNNSDNSSEDEISCPTRATPIPHPAIDKLYSSIATGITAFDRFKCETVAWTQKYSPKTAAEVLQPGKEAIVLKDWLRTLTVKSVGTKSTSVGRPPAKEPSAKRKRKSKKLDSFIVSSDDDSDGMDELSDSDEDPSRGAPKTVVRVSAIAHARGSKESARFANGVVISGPHGCGKTAAVYAVAMELGFEVFEINSSSRRSGKDILEKVGDMTRNHLVQRSDHQQPKVDPVDEDAQRISDALENDLKSGRQGTMNSFFKSSVTKKIPTSKESATAATKVASAQSAVPSKAPPKTQKQSLILLEEVDVLYEEDKLFWVTVMNLIVTSKRPVIMTCTDESAVPLSALSLHAIIRFVTTPVSLAADHLLLVAANEGHDIDRSAVIALYESRHRDLRASITDLSFWCQFAIGDFRGGLDWIYQRGPNKSDIDNHGQTIRTISEGTFVAGMGCFSRDWLDSHCDHYLDIEEMILHEAWDSWSLEAGDWHSSLDMTGWSERLQSHLASENDRLSFLNGYEEFASAMSAADLCSGGAFASGKEILLDVSLPELTDKAREDYIQSYPIMEATDLSGFVNLGSDISLWIQSRSREQLQVEQHLKHNLEIPSELGRHTDESLTGLIRNRSQTSISRITRYDYSAAFDPISEPEKKYVWSNTGQVEACSFDRTMAIIALDLAPYVRSIVAYDSRLQQDRTRISNLLSEGGRGGKRARTTRAALSALEGGARASTRREKYFGDVLNPHFVLRTGLRSWLDAAEIV